MFKYLALEVDVAHDSSLLKVLVEDNALKTHLVLIIALFVVVCAFIPSNKIEKYHTQIIAEVLDLLISYNLVKTGECNVTLFNQLS
jgi:hypothetical protein